MQQWLAFLLVTLLAPSISYAQGARDLAPPWDGSTPPPVAPSTTPTVPSAPLTPVPTIGGAPDEVQDIHPEAPIRRFGDGHQDDVPWSDAELDLRPMGYFHAGLFGMAGVITATSHTPLSPDIALGAFVDFALEPHLSLHLRVGVLARARFAGTVVGADLLRGDQAALSGRGFALIGAHFFQVLALRVGFELGGSATLGSVRAGSGVGWAAVLQLGVRFDDGHVEIVIDGAMDSHEGTFYRMDGSEARFTDQPSPRLLIGLIGEFG